MTLRRPPSGRALGQRIAEHAAELWYRAKRVPSVCVQQDTNQTLTTGVAAAIIWETLHYDTDHMFLRSDPTKLWIRTPGEWAGDSIAAFADNITGFRAINWRINGTTVAGRVRGPATTGDDTQIPCPLMLGMLDAGDYLQLLVQQNSLGDLALDSSIARLWRVGPKVT